jgi:adenylyltransferase/sulfurtransferase
MSTDVLKIRLDSTPDAQERFSRFSLIDWWDQKKLAKARVMVVGAGALGNEIIKNLALVGVGNLFIADRDRIENSNLSRSILFREDDAGQPKAAVAAQAARKIYPGMKVAYFDGDIIHDLGAGVFRWADLVIAGLDNREARLTINRHCWRLNRPWIDGAIEQIQGTARVFIPGGDGPCYECTMSERDWKVLAARRSCNLLTRQQMEQGHTPTTPTISSIIAGVQCQEAIKLLHGLPSIAGQGWIFQGLSTDAYTTTFQRKHDCYSHDTLDEIVPLDQGAAGITLRQLLAKAEDLCGAPVPLELCRDVLEKLACTKCGAEEAVFTSLSSVSVERAACAKCQNPQRDVVTFDRIRGDEFFLDRTPADIGLPAMDLLIARSKDRSFGLELSGDGSRVLGELYDSGLEFV